MEAKISVLDPGLQHGEGVFETMRGLYGRVFRLGRHLDRLEKSAGFIGLELPPRNVIEEAIGSTLLKSRLEDAKVKLIITPGLPKTGTTLIVQASGLEEDHDPRTELGLRAVTMRPLGGKSLGIKSLSYLSQILARHVAQEKNAEEAILINERDEVLEGSVTNVFVVKRTLVATPHAEAGILLGVTREVVIELCRSLGIQFEERPVALKELVEADEIFVTNALLGVAGIVALNGESIGSGPGLLTRTIRSAYFSMVEKELGVALRRFT